MGLEKTAIHKAVGPVEDDGKSTCLYCGKKYVATASRITEHLSGGMGNIAGCTGSDQFPEDIIAALEAKGKTISNKRKRERNQQSVTSFFASDCRENADIAVAELVYGCALPFNLLRSKYFQNALQAARKAPADWKPPGSEKVRTTLLDKVQARCHQSLQPIRDQHRNTGMTITSDAWDNVAGRHLFNFMLVSSMGTIFHSAEDCTTERATGTFIAETICKVIEDVGPDQVVQVSFDVHEFSIIYDECGEWHA